MEISAVNENTVIVYIADQADPQTIVDIACKVRQIKSTFGSLIIDIVPSYTSILIEFNLAQIPAKDFYQVLAALCAEGCDKFFLNKSTEIIELPVYYGQEVALDQREVCAFTGLSVDALVNLHSAVRYRVYAIGFLPGFAYLGHTDERLTMPRKTTPRTRIPAGSLAIADRQTAIYPRQSPGGWQVIGRTPRAIIDLKRENLTLFEVGAEVRFKPISKAVYLELGGRLEPPVGRLEAP